MILEIPINTDLPDQKFTIDLDKRIYQIRIRFNFRSGRWTMAISTEAGVLLVAGIPLVAMWPVMQRFKDERLPPGDFMVRDLTDKFLEPREDSFGSTHLLLYREAVGV